MLQKGVSRRHTMIFSSLKNLVCYRSDKFVDTSSLSNKISRSGDLAAMKSLLTDIMLRAVGLKLTESEESISRFIYLTKVQRCRRRLAENAGYSVGLL